MISMMMRALRGPARVCACAAGAFVAIVPSARGDEGRGWSFHIKSGTNGDLALSYTTFLESTLRGLTIFDEDELGFSALKKRPRELSNAVQYSMEARFTAPVSAEGPFHFGGQVGATFGMANLRLPEGISILAGDLYVQSYSAFADVRAFAQWSIPRSPFLIEGGLGTKFGYAAAYGEMGVWSFALSGWSHQPFSYLRANATFEPLAGGWGKPIVYLESTFSGSGIMGSLGYGLAF